MRIRHHHPIISPLTDKYEGKAYETRMLITVEVEAENERKLVLASETQCVLVLLLISFNVIVTKMKHSGQLVILAMLPVPRSYLIIRSRMQ